MPIHIYIKMIGTLKNNKGIASQLMILDTKGMYKICKKIIRIRIYKKNKIKLPTNSANIYILFFDI